MAVLEQPTLLVEVVGPAAGVEHPAGQVVRVTRQRLLLLKEIMVVMVQAILLAVVEVLAR